MSYKHFISITSQLPFCSTPIRLDAYNSCQFGCTYCFAKSRGGNIASSKAELAKADLLSSRLRRVSKGNVSSALDEFLFMRVPIQFGGMSDPFSPWEEKHRATLRLLEVLKDFDYPTIISTKGTLFASDEYARLMRDGNFYVRVSITGAAHRVAGHLEAGVPDISSRLNALGRLASMGIPTSVRLQPIIPGHESSAAELLYGLAATGVRHVSGEYLKLPVEHSRSQSLSLERSLPGIRQSFERLGAVRVGREYVLPAQSKIIGHELLETTATELGLVYGYADNEFLLRNRFSACCNASDLFLRNASVFRSNILGILKSTKDAEAVKLSWLPETGLPAFPLDTYLNSRSRPKVAPGTSSKERWIALLRGKWNSSGWRGGPASFWMVEDTNEVDQNGDKVYALRDPALGHPVSGTDGMKESI